jgi:hypothetical protein
VLTDFSEGPLVAVVVGQVLERIVVEQRRVVLYGQVRAW